MRVTDDQLKAVIEELLSIRAKEKERLERIWRYWRNDQQIAWLPTDVPDDIKRMAEFSKVNIFPLIVNNVVQSMYVDGYRSTEGDDLAVWDVWQANRMDARQTAIHRCRSAYGVAYATCVAGEPVPVINPASPRRLTAAYADDDEWPEAAIEYRGRDLEGRRVYRLYDDQEIRVFTIERVRSDATNEARDVYEVTNRFDHGAPGVVPIVRYLDEDDGEGTITGEIEPLIEVQDQINLTTFGLMVAQHFSAFKQRYILGWVADTEADKFKVAASRVLTFEDHPDDLQIGEFAQTDLNGYISSRKASVEHAAALSQTPAHELLGQLINLSAEALAAAEASKARKLMEREALSGESHEQLLRLASVISGIEVDDGAEVVWRDTEARALTQTVTALGMMAQTLGVPVTELWEQIPGVTKQQVERWKQAASSPDAIEQLRTLLETQAGGMEPAPVGGNGQNA